MHHFKLGQNTQNVLYWFFAGASLGFSFLHASLWLLGFVGIILLLRAVYHSQNFKQVLFGSVFMGWLYFGLVLAWYWSVYPINGFVISPTLSILAIFISWFLCALFLGFGKLLVVLPLYFYKDTQYKKYVLWALPLLWVLSDMLGAFLFTIQSYGAGSTLNTKFSFGWLGYLLADHVVLGTLATWGGVFILTFVYVYVALLFDRVLQADLNKKWFILLGMFLTLILTGVLFASEKVHDESLKVAALDTSLPSVRGVSEEDLPAYQTELMQHVTKAITDGAAYVILPEGARMTGVFTSPEEALGYIANIAPADVVVVDSGWYHATEERSYVRAFIYDTRTMSIYKLDKKYLVPQGEFMSYLFGWMMRIVGFSDEVDGHRRLFDYVPGELSDNPQWPAHLPGVMFCFESVDPWGVRKAASYREVPFVAHPVSHAWFHEPSVLWNQLDQMLKVNSRFAGVTVYQAANMYEAKRY